MGLINKDTFVCLDCETTGLDANDDEIIEIAAVKFTFEKTISSYESLINPQRSIPEKSQAIHHITDQMVFNKPKIQEILPFFIQFVGNHIVIGHGVGLDIAFVQTATKKHQIPCRLDQNIYLDTLRMARLYGESPINSLEQLRQHFNIAAEGAHRAMNDVVVNIEVFKHLAQNFKTTEDLIERMKRPVSMKTMPLGKHKGRLFAEIPLDYLLWAAKKDFDQDLLFSIRSEVKKRKKGNLFGQASNPFSSL